MDNNQRLIINWKLLNVDSDSHFREVEQDNFLDSEMTDELLADDK